MREFQPSDIEDSLEAIERLHSEHYETAPPSQRLINNLTAQLARPRSVAAAGLLVVSWIGANAAMENLGGRAFDPPPFQWLALIGTLGALFTTGLILVAQRHDDALASRREQLILELAILTEGKCAKIIELLEELRRDDPLLTNRQDQQAAKMASPAEPGAILDAIKTDKPGG